MIFVSLGTDHHPFNRLVDWLSEALERGIIDEQVVIQHGSTQVADPRMEKYEMVGFDQMMKYFDEADLVITHASSTAMLVCHHGKRPMVLAREAVHGEHIDDHQLEFVKATRGIYDFYIADTKEKFFAGLQDKEMVSRWSGEFTVGGKAAIEKFGIEFRKLVDCS